MKRTTLNLLVDLISFADLLLLAGTGAILRWVLPPGSGGHGYGFRGARGPLVGTQAFTSLRRHDWGDIHFLLALLFVFLMLVHLYLHWTWILACGKSILFPHRGVPCDPRGKSEMP